MKTIISFGFLIICLVVASSDTYAAGNGKKGNTPVPTPNPAQLKQRQHHQPKRNPVGQNPRPIQQVKQPLDCTKIPGPKMSPVSNFPKNGNWNGNKNGNTNTSANANTNRINNSNDINIRFNLGRNGTNGNGGNGGNGGVGSGNGGWKNGWNSNGGWSGSGSGDWGYGGGGGGYGGYGMSGYGGSYTGGTYAPTGGAYAPTYAFNPTYDYSGWNSNATPYAPYVAPLGLPPIPNEIAFNGENPDTAWLTLELPDEEAEVWLNGVRQTIKGPVRKYITPPLQKDKIYNYEIKVQWPVEKGRPKGARINYNTTISFKAGDEILHKVPDEGDGNVAAPPPKLEQDEEKLMNQRLHWAKELLKEGKKDKAKERLQDIVNKSPDSLAGKEAKELLSKIN